MVQAAIIIGQDRYGRPIYGRPDAPSTGFSLLTTTAVLPIVAKEPEDNDDRRNHDPPSAYDPHPDFHPEIWLGAHARRRVEQAPARHDLAGAFV
jgi:hypothetical protein